MSSISILETIPSSVLLVSQDFPLEEYTSSTSCVLKFHYLQFQISSITVYYGVMNKMPIYYLIICILLNIAGYVSYKKNAKPVNIKILAIFLTVTLTSFLIDFFSKLLALTYLGEKTVPIIGKWLYLKLAHNPGAAFSLLSGKAWVMSIIAVFISGFIIYIIPRVTSKTWALALGMLLGGALSNLFDRLFRPPYYGQGHVVDFIGYYDWFIGNIADIFIFVSILVVLFLEFVFNIECISTDGLSDTKTDIQTGEAITDATVNKN